MTGGPHDPPRIYFRLVTSSPPSVADFLSNEARGRVPRRPQSELEEKLWSYLSVFETEDQARAQAAKFPMLGGYIAAVRITRDSAVEVLPERGRNGHRSIKGDPDDLLRSVIDVTAVTLNRE